MDIPDNLVLVFGGGNALGAYQAGAYEALHERGHLPARLTGASIGAVNAALIAGNAPDRRLPRLRAFWRVAEQFGKATPSGRMPPGPGSFMTKRMAAAQSMATGRPGLFSPRMPGLWSALPGMPDDVSLFDTKPLRATLRELIDFDLLNEGAPRFTATAVDVETGADVLFDSATMRIDVEHIRASAAFPVAYPPVAIGGRVLIDPGLSANLPLAAALSEPPETDTVCLAVDLFALEGRRPASLGDAAIRAQDIVFASQGRRAIDALETEYRLRDALRASARQPSRRRGGGQEPASGRVTVLHLVYSDDGHEVAGKMLDYSADSIGRRWASGRRDMDAALAALKALPEPGASTFSAHRMERGRFGRAGRAAE